MHIERFCQPYRPVQAQCLGGKIDARSNKRAFIGCFHGKLVEGESCISRIVAFGGFDHVWHMARPYSRARYGM